ncbi:hypothetical protein TNCV_679631 [Trichonephila clavipes]|nr:hypothetical protein TNCV_679631 [Trichonephila clavipes]
MGDKIIRTPVKRHDPFQRRTTRMSVSVAVRPPSAFESKNRQKELHASNLYGRVGIRKPLVTACHAYSDASGVEHTDSGPHNSGNKSSGRMNRRSPYSKPPDAFMCGERPKKHLLLNASC